MKNFIKVVEDFECENCGKKWQEMVIRTTVQNVYGENM